MSDLDRALAALLKQQGRTLTQFEREQVLYLANTLAASGPTVLEHQAWDTDLLLLALETAGYVIVTEPGDRDETTLHVMACGAVGTWLITQTYEDGRPHAQVQCLIDITRLPGPLPSITLGSWLQVLLRFLYTDLPAIMSTELNWGENTGPTTLADLADTLIAQNDADPQPAARTANRQAGRILHALGVLTEGQDPGCHLVTADEVIAAAQYAAVVAAENEW
ncbi:MAG: hypothetical protein KKA73_18365 [Chloroflexi bacterium]|nr:hypothetical protein [Chloroflexota bacterium]MBU1749652.1 hypothetical protein [Chloroflexota bacterium]